MLSIPITNEHAAGDVRKRRAARQRIETLVYADLGPGNGGFPINISKMGMAFQGIQPLGIGQVICIKFKLPGIKELVESAGHIIWLDEFGKGGGLEFIDLGEESSRLIDHWLSLQTRTDCKIQSVPSSPHEMEKNALRFPNPPPPSDHEGSKAFRNNLSLISQSLPSLLSTMTGSIADNKSAANSVRSQGKAEPVVRNSESKRTWLIPFTIGLMTSAAIILAVMVVLGVISIQFRWPQQTADASLTHPVSEIGSAKVIDSPPTKISHDESSSYRAATDLAASTPPSTTSTKSSIVEPAAPTVTSPQPSRARTASTSKMEAPKTPSLQAPTPKAVAPSPSAPARTLDFVPPIVGLPTEPGTVPQLSMASPELPRPALPGIPAGLATSKLDAPVLIKRTDPVYSAEAKEKGISGAVELQFGISTDGNVRDVRVIKGNPLLVRAALDTIKTWHYQPARRNGIPIQAESSAVFNFRPN